MERMEYLKIPDLLQLIDEPNRQGCLGLYEENKTLFQMVQGSTNNHQAWPGGYHDHVQEVLNIGKGLYEFYASLGRPLPFSLSDVLLVLFLHDIEKPWKYDVDELGALHIKVGLVDKEAQHKFRVAKLQEHNIVLNNMQQNGLRYVEGEMGEYSSRRRVMNELAALCHLADVTSARIFYNYPLVHKDPLAGASRVRD